MIPVRKYFCKNCWKEVVIEIQPETVLDDTTKCPGCGSTLTDGRRYPQNVLIIN